MRCFVDTPGFEMGERTLDRSASHHLARVLRVTPGTSVTLFNGRGVVAESEVAHLSKTSVTVAVTACRSTPPPHPRITLAQAAIRAQKMDLIIQKTVELGATQIIPMETAHGVVRLDPRQGTSRVERWTKIMHGAAEQCGIDWIPQLDPGSKLGPVLERIANHDLTVICSLGEGARPLKSVLEQGRRHGVEKLMILVGPEGDFSPEEYAQAIQAGAQPVTLGPRVLRAETAALFALSSVQYEWMDGARAALP